MLQGCRTAKFSKQKQNNILLAVLSLEGPPPTYHINIIQPINKSRTYYNLRYLNGFIRDRRMNHRHTPRLRVEMMLLMNAHHLKSSSQIQRKTWPGDQVPDDAIDQNSAK